MGGETFASISRLTRAHKPRGGRASVTLAVFLSSVLLCTFVAICECQRLNPEHRDAGDEGGIPLEDYGEDDGEGVVPIMSHRQGLQHEDVFTALPSHYLIPNQAQFPPSPVYQANGTSAQSTSATPAEGSKDGKNFTPPNDIVRGFKPVYPDDARFVSITTSTVGPPHGHPPKRRKKVKRVKGQNQQQQQQQNQQGQQGQQQPQQGQQQGFQNSFGYQPAGPGAGPYFHPYAHSQVQNSGPYFAAANHFYGYSPNGLDGQNGSYPGHVAFPNEANGTSGAPPGFSTLYSTNPNINQGQDNPHQQQYQQQQSGPYLSSGVPLAGAPGYGGPPGPHGPPLGPHGYPMHGPPKMNPLKKLANLIRGRPRPPHMGQHHGPPPPGHGGMPPPGHQGPGAPGVPYQHLAASVNQQQVVPPGQPYPGPGPHGQGPPRHPPYNPNQPPQYQHPQQPQPQQGQQAPPQNQTQPQQNSNSTSPVNPQAAASNNQGAYPGFPGGQPPPYGPHRPPNPNKNFLSKLNLNGYLKKFSNMFRTGPPQPGQGAPQGVLPPGPPGPGGKPGVAVPLVQQHGPPPQQKVPQQMLYPHYYPMNSYAPNGPNGQVHQGQYQQQGQPQNPQQAAPGGQGQNQIRRRRIKIRKNSGMDPRNRKVDDAPEGQGDQKELIGRPRLAPGQTNDAENVEEDMMAEGEPPREIDPNAGGKKRRKRLATTGSVITSSSSSTSTSSSSGYRMPGLFGMDSGKAFYLDKDPQTGDITFNPPSGENKNGQNNSGNGSPSNSNELSPDAKSKPIIIHSYSNTKTQGGLSTYKRPNLSSLNHKFKAKRPTFYRFNKTVTLAPPRLPSFYVPSSTTVFTTTSTTTTSAPSPSSGESTGKTEFPNVIVAKSSSEIVTRVSMSSSSSSSKEIAGPQFKKKSPVKFPLFKHTTPSTTTTSESSSTAETTTTSTTEASTTVPTTTEGSTAPPEPETSTPSTTTTTEEPTSSTMFFDPYLPFELLNLQKQAMATARTPTTTTTTTTTEAPTTTSTSTTTEHSTIPTTVDPYTVPDTVKAVPTTASSSTTGSEGGAESPSTVAPGQTPENANGSSLIPTGPDGEQVDTSQEQQDEDEDYYYDNPDPGQGYVVNPGQFNSFGQFRPGSIPPHHQHPGGYPYNPMMGGGLQGRPPVVPPQHNNNFFSSFNPFGPPGYYPQPPPQNIQGGGGAGYFTPEFGQGVTGPEPVPSTNDEVISNSSVAATTEDEEVTTPSTTSTTTIPSTTTTIPTTTTTTPEPTTTTEPTTQSTTTPTTTTTVPPPPPTQEDLLGEPDIYEEYEDELELDPSGLPPTLQQPQQKLPPNSFQLPLPPQPPQRPQPPLPPHRRPPPPFINRLPPMYFNNQRPPPVRPQAGNFPFRPPPPVKEVMKTLTSGELTPAPTTTTTSTTPSTTTTASTTPSTTTTTTTTTTTQPPTTTSTTTTTPTPPPSSPSPEPHIPSESREAVINQDLFIPPEQLLAYTPSPDRAQDRIPDEVIQDIAPGFDLFNVQWGQKVPPPSSTSYSSQELQPIPMQAQLSTTTQAPPTTRIISRNITEVNINGTDYIYEYIDEIVEEDVPTNSSQNAPPSEQGNNVAPTSAIPQQQQQFISPEQFYNPYLLPQYNGFVPVTSTPGYGGAGPPYMMPNGAPAWLQNGYYLPPGVLPNQYPIQGVDGSQQFIPVGAHFNPSSIAPPQDLGSSPSPSSPSPSPSSAGPILIPSMGSSHEILSDTSILPPVIPITENSVDNISPSQEQHNQEQIGAELSESYIVSLIDPSKQNVTVTLNGIIGSSTERLPLYQGEADTVEHTNLLVSSTSGTPSPGGVEHIDGISHISSPAPAQTDSTASTTTTEKAASYEYIDYPDENLAAVPGGGQGGSPQQQQQQLHNLQALQMMRPPPPLPPHLQQQQLQHQQQTQALLGIQGQQGPPHGPHGPHGPKKKPSSFLQNLFGKLTGNGGPPPQQNGPYPPQGPPQQGGPGQNRNNFAGDNIASASGPIGAGSPLLPPVMIPNGVDPEKFNMDTLFGARNGTAAEDPQPPAPSSTQTTSTTAGTSSTSTTTTGQASALSAEFGSDEEDEVIYVTPEELAKLKETGQVDDFELVEDEDEYEYEDEPLNDIADNKLARSDTKSLSGLGQNGTSELLKKTAPVASPPVSEAPSTTTPSTTTTTSTAAPPPVPSSSQVPPVLEAVAQERKQDFYGGVQQQSYGQQVPQTPPAALPSIPSLGMFQMKPPSEFIRPPHSPPPHPHQGMPPHHPHSHPHQQHQPHHPHQYHQQQHHQGRIPVPPPPPPSFRGPYQHPQHPPSIPNPSHNHYKPNVGHGQVAPPAGHYYNNQMTAGSVLPSSAPPAPSPADKRQDGFQAKYDYDDDIELITAGPMLDPNVPRDIIVKSSFNTASGSQAKPKSIAAPASLSPPSPSPSGGWQGGVENVSSFDRRTGYLQQPSPSARLPGPSSPSHHHEPFSTSSRALPNHYDKNAHLRQLQQGEGDSSSHYNGGGSHVSSNRNYWGPGI